MNKKNILDQVKAMLDRYEKLPDHAMMEPMNGYDFRALLWIMYEMLKEED